jgi:pimeloyl-ACP methyl ester carboxylesterase
VVIIARPGVSVSTLIAEQPMIPANETFDGTFPFQPHFTTAPGFRMHYVDEGSGSPIICLHGEPTWSYLYRKFIPPLAKDFRVIAPDHMGFGKSETPQDREYTLRTHVENLSALIDELNLKDITFVLQDWGGPIGGAYTLRNPERVRRLVLMNTILGYSAAVTDLPRDPANKPPRLVSSNWFRWVKKSVDDGSFYEQMGRLGSHIGDLMGRLGMRGDEAKTETWLRAYSAHFKTPADCKGAIEFPLDIIQDRMVPYVLEGFPGVPELRRKPAMLAEGMADQAIPPELAIADFKMLFPAGPVVRLDGVGHFCQEDAPEALVAMIQLFIQMT